MGRNTGMASQIAKDTLRRFPNAEIRSLARYLVAIYPDLYNSDFEFARGKIKYHAGKIGIKNKKNVFDKSLFRGEYKMPKSVALVRKSHKLDNGLWFILNDIHVPFHSERAIDIAFKYAQLQKPTGILINGDMQDCEALSYWHSPYRRDFVKEVEQVIDFIDFLVSSFPDIKIVWKPGNHEDRLAQYYRSNAPLLADLPSSDMENILSLDTRGVLLLNRKQKVMAGKLPIFHGHEIRGGGVNLVNPARWLFLKTKHSAACSHFHRTSEHAEKDVMGKDMATFTFGCLCSLEPDYNPEANNWNHGFGMINISSNGDYEVENKKILSNGRVV